MNYDEALEFLQNLTKFGFNFGLGRIEELMKRVGNPQNNLKFIHVGGTNGKGSTSAIMSSILQTAGYQVGVFSSPHLHSYRERYQINNVQITEAKVAAYISRLKPHLEQMVEEGFEHPTEFEVGTAIAFLYFAEENVDFVILEVGLGGAIDSTNIITPMVSVITNVAMDHMDYLGNSVKEIATVKSGIIKPNGIIVTAAEDTEALEVIRNQVQEKEARLVEVFKETNWSVKESSMKQQVFDLNTNKRSYKDLVINLIGDHQIINAATAISVIEIMEELGVEIKIDAITKGLGRVSWPARLEIVRENPTVVIDGAHNVEGAKSLRAALEKVFSYEKLTLVFGMLGDKEREKVVSELAPLASRVIVTRPNSPRSGEWEKVADEVKKYVNDVAVIDDIHQAVEKALNSADTGDLVCITGSLYMIADARAYFIS